MTLFLIKAFIPSQKPYLICLRSDHCHIFILADQTINYLIWSNLQLCFLRPCLNFDIVEPGSNSLGLSYINKRVIRIRRSLRIFLSTLENCLWSALALYQEKRQRQNPPPTNPDGTRLGSLHKDPSPWRLGINQRSGSKSLAGIL